MMSSRPLQRKLRRVNVRRQAFVHRARGALTHRRDGTSWSRSGSTYRVASRYMEGLLAPGRRKNMSGIAKRAALDRDRVERFIRDSPWDPSTVQDHVRACVPAHFDEHACMVIDDFGIAKQGRHSVGVQRQYSGTLGKTGNCQVAVNLTLAQPGTRRNADQATWPLGTQLYLPRSWIQDSEYASRREEVRLPSDVTFRSKGQIALQMVQTAWKTGVKARAVVGDAEYGRDSSLRRALRSEGQAYVLGMQPAQARFVPADVEIQAREGKPNRFSLDVKPVSVAQFVPDAQWETISWGMGTKGEMSAEFARMRVRPVADARRRWLEDEVVWLLLERRRNTVKAYVCWGLDEASLDDLAGVAHLRWTIEQYHKEAKQLLGMDQFEGRSWPGWNRHIAMVILAYAFIALLRLEGQSNLPSLREVARVLVIESTTQALMDEHGLKRSQAEPIAETSVRRLTDL